MILAYASCSLITYSYFSLHTQGADDMHRGPESRPRRDDYHQPSHEMAAREFDGTFDVKPQVYGTYGNENDYPPPQHARDNRDSQRDYQGVDYRDHPDARARYQPPERLERQGYRPPPPRDRDYYPPPQRNEHEHGGYRRDYPPPPPRRELPHLNEVMITDSCLHHVPLRTIENVSVIMTGGLLLPVLRGRGCTSHPLPPMRGAILHLRTIGAVHRHLWVQDMNIRQEKEKVGIKKITCASIQCDLCVHVCVLAPNMLFQVCACVCAKVCVCVCVCL